MMRDEDKPSTLIQPYVCNVLTRSKTSLVAFGHDSLSHTHCYRRDAIRSGSPIDTAACR